jgi:hypothetical protein
MINKKALSRLLEESRVLKSSEFYGNGIGFSLKRDFFGLEIKNESWKFINTSQKLLFAFCNWKILFLDKETNNSIDLIVLLGCLR